MMTEPTKENLEESRQWRVEMLREYRTNKLTKQQIQQLEAVPNWSWEYRKSSDESKEMLLALARNKSPRPKNRTSLNKALQRYTQTTSKCYDAVFSKKIRALRPDWFINAASNSKKKELLVLARNGSPKPKNRTPLNDAFKRYTQATSKCYDAAFTRKIQVFSSEWLNKTKKELLELAESGAPKPKNRTRLNNAYKRYTKTSSRCYDAVLTEKIRDRCLKWFINAASSSKKEELLVLARNGALKPKNRTPLNDAFKRYTQATSKCYDAVFSKKIRTLRPDWFQVA